MSRIVILLTSFLLASCVTDESGQAISPQQGAPGFSAPLSAETGQGSVTILEGARVLSSFATALPNVEQTRWVQEQEQIVVKSRGNHGPATVELFDSRTGNLLGSVEAYEAATGPEWARPMAE